MAGLITKLDSPNDWKSSPGKISFLTPLDPRERRLEIQREQWRKRAEWTLLSTAHKMAGLITKLDSPNDWKSSPGKISFLTPLDPRERRLEIQREQWRKRAEWTLLSTAKKTPSTRDKGEATATADMYSGIYKLLHAITLQTEPMKREHRLTRTL